MKSSIIRRISLIVTVALFSATFNEAKAEEKLGGMGFYIVAGAIGLSVGGFFWLKNKIQGTKDDLRDNYSEAQALYNSKKYSQAKEKYSEYVKLYETESKQKTKDKDNFKQMYSESKSKIPECDSLQTVQEKERAMDLAKPYLEKLDAAKAKCSEAPFESSKMIDAYISSIGNISSHLGAERGEYNSWTSEYENGKEGIGDVVQQLLYADTAAIREFSRSCIEQYLSKNQSLFNTISQKQKRMEKLSSEISTVSRDIMIISGSVEDIQGSTLQIWGTAVPYEVYIAKSSLSNSIFGDLSDLYGAEIAAAAEGVPGVVMEDANLVVNEYSKTNKASGAAVRGQNIVIVGYKYSHRTSGISNFGGTVPIFHYALHPAYKKLDALITQKNSVKKDIEKMLESAGITEKQYEKYVLPTLN